MSLINPEVLFSQPRRDWFRTYRHQDYIYNGLRDIFLKVDGGLIMCGTAFQNIGESNKMWVINTGEDGAVLWDDIYQAPGRRETYSVGRTIIQTDDGQFLVGGISDGRHQGCSGDFAVLLLNEEGEIVWYRYYGSDNDHGACQAVIELKSGEFAVAGYLVSGNGNQANRDAYVALIDNEGDIIWENIIGVPRNYEEFVAMREVPEEGIVLGGYIGEIMQSNADFWLVKVNFEGEVIWERRYEEEGYQEAVSMTSCQNGFVIAGNLHSGMVNHDFILKRVNREGEPIFTQIYRIWENIGDNNYAELCGIARLPDDGFVLVGRAYLGRGPTYPAIMIRTSGGGEELWRLSQNIAGDTVRTETNFDVALSDPHGSIIVAGNYGSRIGNRMVNYGFVQKFFPDRNAPEIIWFTPDFTPIGILPTDTIPFGVSASDPDSETMTAYWVLSGNVVDSMTLESGDTIWWRFHPDSSGEYLVQCVISDGYQHANVEWLVYVQNLVISNYYPRDLFLTVRRGREMEFGIEVRYVHNMGEPIFRWNILDILGNQRAEVGQEMSIQIVFDRVGQYLLEGMASLDIVSDSKNWNISVRGLLRAFWPNSISLSVTPNTEVHFGVNPFDPNDPTLRYWWGIDADTLASESQITEQVLAFPEVGQYSVWCLVRSISDSLGEVVESDSQFWRVTVSEPEGIDGG
ncbi:MAG: hypothetical protein QW815_09870, partial [Nitrososphaerota archaeon]